MLLDKTTAIVTGASRGIGRAIAKRLAIEGAQVALIARSNSALVETQDMIRKAGGMAEVFTLDLRNEQALNNFAQTLLAKWGRVDIIVNNAGAWHNDSRSYYGPYFANTSAEEINEVIDVGLRAPLLLTRLFLPGMIERKRGKILQISGGFAGTKDAIGWVHTYVTKKGVEHFTEGLAEELREHEIQVNCISPWYVNTEPVREYMSEYIESALEPDEIANLALFLVSPQSDHITGQTILIRNKKDHGQ